MSKSNNITYISEVLRDIISTGRLKAIPVEICDSISRMEDDDLKQLLQHTVSLINHMNESKNYIASLAAGNINVEADNRNLLLSPFKQLQASLKHLTWQAQRLSEGDLEQSIDFMGEFSTYFNRLIESLREKRVIENKLKYQTDNYRISFENANIGIMTVDLDGTIISVNKECENIFGYKRDDLEGMNVNSYYLTVDYSISNEYINTALNNPAAVNKEFIKRYYHKSGNIITCQVSSSLLHDSNGKPVYFISHIKDITLQLEMNKRQKELNLQLETNNKELKEANDTRDKFMSIIAHDLKNPFNVILGFSSLLHNNIDNFSSDEIKMMSQHIHDTTLNTFNLLETLLQWSNAQRGRMTFNPSQIDVNDVITEVISTLKNHAGSKDIAITFDPSHQLKAFADHNMVSTILRNLISNAIKFTPCQGTISIKAVQAGSKIVFSITDSGVGMSEELINKLFKIDEKVSMPGTNHESGTGLGLLLCKEFVDKHHGTITVTSEPNKGSTFTFTLPTL